MTASTSSPTFLLAVLAITGEIYVGYGLYIGHPRGQRAAYQLVWWQAGALLSVAALAGMFTAQSSVVALGFALAVVSALASFAFPFPKAERKKYFDPIRSRDRIADSRRNRRLPFLAVAAALCLFAPLLATRG